MKSFKLFTVIICLFVVTICPAVSQNDNDDGTYIEISTEQDSSHVSNVLDFSGEYEDPSGSSTVWIGLVIIVVAGIAYFVVKKKKKS